MSYVGNPKGQEDSQSGLCGRKKINDGGQRRERSCGAMIMILNFILKARNLIIKWKNFKIWPFLLPSKEGDQRI